MERHRRLSEDALLSVSSRSEPEPADPLAHAVELSVESESDAPPTDSPADSPDLSLQDLHPDIARQFKARFKPNGNGQSARTAPISAMDTDSNASSPPSMGRRNSRSRRASIASISKQLSDRSVMVDHLEKASTTASKTVASSALSYNSDDWATTATMIEWDTIFSFIRLPLATCCTLSLAVCLLVQFTSVVVFVPQEVPVALGAVMGLLLAFRLNASYGRWWEGRLLWGNIILR